MLPVPVVSPSDPGPERPGRRRSPLAVAVLLVTALVAALAVPVHAQEAPTTEDPAEAAAGWLARQLTDGERFEAVFGEDVFPDFGLTIDAVLAFTAAGVADDFAEAALAWLTEQQNLDEYLGFGPGSAGKLALALLARGLDPADVLTSEEQSPIDIILAADTTPGENSYFDNPINVALAIIALHRAEVPIPDDLRDLLLALQCEDGSFSNPFPPEGSDPCPGGVDHAAFGLQALLLVEPDEDVVIEGAGAGGDARAAATPEELAAAIAGALDYLLAEQGADGSLAGGNVNSTGVAAQALAAAGQAGPAADAAAFLVSVQLRCAAAEGDRGAFAVDGSADVRATTQAVPGLLAVSLVGLTGAADALGVAPVLACPADTGPPATAPEVPGSGGPTPVPGTGGPESPAPGSPPATAAQATPTFAG